MKGLRKRYGKQNQKFEDGVLRADACSQRYAIPRNNQYHSSFEDLPQHSFGASALWEERRLMNAVYALLAQGIRPGKESLEDFVARNQHRLGGDLE